MGRLNTSEEREHTLLTAEEYVRHETSIPRVSDPRKLRSAFERELKHYFALAALSRSKSSHRKLVESAHAVVFKFRIVLERRLAVALKRSHLDDAVSLLEMGCFYGFSKKQGT